MDRERVTQILLNLLMNAQKFTREGWVELACFNAQEGILFEVTDTGVGIAPHKLPYVFSFIKPEEYNESKTPSARGEIHSAGVGLAISQKIASYFNSQIYV